MSIDTLLAEVRAECATMLPGATVELLRGGGLGGEDCIHVDVREVCVNIYADGNVYHRTPWRTALAEMRADLFRMRRNIDRALWGADAKPGGGA